MNRPWRRVGLWALAGSHVLADFYVGAAAATLPYFVKEAHYSYAAVAGLALALTSVASVAQPGFGYLADRFRLRWAIPACVGATALAISLASSMAGTYALVWTMVALAGVASAAYHPPATIALRDVAPGSNAAMSVFAAAGNVGVALGPIAVVVVLGNGGLAASPLLLVPAAVGLVGYALAARLDTALGPRATRHPTERAAKALAQSGAAIPGEPSAATEQWGMFARLVLTITAWSVVFTGTIAFIGLFVIEQFALSEEAAAAPLSLFPAAGAVGTLLGGWLADRVGRLTTIRAGYAVAAVAAAMIAGAPSPWVAIAATGLLGAGLFLPFAPQLTLAHSYLPGHVGMASGIALGVTSAVGGGVSAVLGHVGEAWGLRVVFVSLTGSLVAGLCCALFLHDPERRHRSRSAPQPHSASLVTAERDGVR